MSGSRRRAHYAVVALCLLAALAGTYAGEYVHTDDGCAFETHCLVCQRQIGSLAVVGSPLPAPPPLEPLGEAVVPPTLAPVPAPVIVEVPRGPPSA